MDYSTALRHLSLFGHPVYEKGERNIPDDRLPRIDGIAGGPGSVWSPRGFWFKSISAVAAGPEYG